MPDLPQPPRPALTYSAIGTGVLAGLLWTASLITFAVRQGEKMAPDEIRLALTALAFGAVTTALWSQWRRTRARYQNFVDNAPFKARLAQFEQHLCHLDQVGRGNGRALTELSDRLEVLDARHQRLANGLEELSVAKAGAGEDTANLIRQPRRRSPQLREVKSS